MSFLKTWLGVMGVLLALGAAVVALLLIICGILWVCVHFFGQAHGGTIAFGVIMFFAVSFFFAMIAHQS